MEEFILLNLCEHLHLDQRYNNENLNKIIKNLENNEIVKAVLKKDMTVKFWNSKTWEKNYNYNKKLELFGNTLDEEPFFSYDFVYVMPEFHNLKLASLPFKLSAGLVGRVYGVALYNIEIEQDQMTNSVLMEFPLKNGLIAPVELSDCVEHKPRSITNVHIFKE